MNAWKSFSWTTLNFLTGLFFHGSCTSNLRCALSLGFGTRGVTVKSRWYSTGSGTPATNFIPQREQLPGAFDRMSRSMGQKYTGSLDGFGVVCTCARSRPTESTRTAIVIMRILHLYNDRVERMSKSMRRLMVIAFLVLGICVDLNAHNVGNAITWNREISRIIYQRCASCHHDGGTAFSLMRYPDVQPRAV